MEYGLAYVKLYNKDLNRVREHYKRLLQTVAETKLLVADNPRVLDVAEMLLKIYLGESWKEDIKRLKKTFHQIRAGEVKGSVDFLPLEKLIRWRTQERLAAL